MCKKIYLVCIATMMNNFCFNVFETFLVPFHYNFLSWLLNCSLSIIDFCHICKTVQWVLDFFQKDLVNKCLFWKRFTHVVYRHVQGLLHCVINCMPNTEEVCIAFTLNERNNGINSNTWNICSEKNKFI